jgi:hypothetical protein
LLHWQVYSLLIELTLGLPPETLRIAGRALAYLTGNAEPIIFPGDDFLTSFSKDETIPPIMDDISHTNTRYEEELQDLKEVVDVEDDVEEDVETVDRQLFPELLSDAERRKMEKVHVQASKDAKKERKKQEREQAKAIKAAARAKAKDEAKTTKGPKIENGDDPSLERSTSSEELFGQIADTRSAQQI